MLTGNKMLGPEAWEAFVQERIALTWMANDIKIIGQAFFIILSFAHRINFSETVTESFGQLVIQGILLIRFDWLVKTILTASG